MSTIRRCRSPGLAPSSVRAARRWLFANFFECLLYRSPEGHTQFEHEGSLLIRTSRLAKLLKIAGFAAQVGLANNVNYGNAAILGLIAPAR